MLSQQKSTVHTELPKQPDMVAIFTLIGAFITGLMSAIGFINNNVPLASILLVASILYIFSFYIHREHGSTRLSASFVIYTLYVLMCYLIYTGGEDSTGILWAYIVAPVTVYIRGLKRGSRELIIFLIAACILMNLPETFGSQQYQTSFQIRFFLSFATVAVLSALYEYSRANWYRHTIALTEQYQLQALHDHLTQIPNRRYARQILEQEQSRVSRVNTSTCLLLCDIDHFKRINDSHGHSAGDYVLTELAKLFTRAIRKHDTVARWGGEEFMFILPQTKCDNALATADKLLELTRQHSFYFEGKKIDVTLSIGISQLSSTRTVEQAINAADELLYQAKTSGRAQVCS